MNQTGRVGLAAMQEMQLENDEEKDFDILMNKFDVYSDPPKRETEEKFKFYTRSKKNNEPELTEKMKEVTKKAAAEKSDAKPKDNSNALSADTNIFSGIQQEWEDRLNKYCAQERQIFRKARSDSLKDETYQNGDANKELKYKRVLYKCKFGNDARIRGTGLRKTRTSRLGCEAFIQLNISKDRQNLIVTNCELSHTNHNETTAFYHLLPENRIKKIPEEKKIKIKEMLNMYANKKLIQNELAKDQIYITLKDLTNMKASTKSVDGDNLKKAVDYLISEGADVDIHTEDNHFRGLFFCTKEMKKSFESYPEMLFIDGTYKLLQLDFTVVILMVEDSNSTSEVVAVGLLVTEDAENYEWFLNTFCKYHPESCKNIKCIMSDKDTTERGVLEKIFVDVPLYICRFHTMQIFKRRTLNLKNKTECLEILQALVYSESAEHYDYHYNKLCCAASGTSFLKYFDDKWHKIRIQWTEYGMIHGNMGNCTNNRVESINQKLKNIIEKRNSLLDFCIKFFKWLYSHSLQNDAKLSKCFTTRPVNLEDPTLSNNKDDITFTKKQYENLLTTYAYELVVQNIERHHPLTFCEINKEDDKFTLNSKSSKITGSSSNCKCAFWSRFLLPCHHILGARKQMNLPLYDAELCAPRWTKNYVKINHRTFNDITKNNCNTSQVSEKGPIIVKKVSNNKKCLTVPEKERKIRPLLNNIAHIISTSCGSKFEEKYLLLKQFSESLTKDYRIQLVTDNMANNIDELKESFTNLNVNSNAKVADICMPVTPKIRGRPSRFLATTPLIKKK